MIPTARFALYPKEQHWWSFTDYACVVETTRGLSARTVLEFGPGSSTLALIEGGATHIDCLEDNPIYFRLHQDQLVARYPEIVTLHRYNASLRIPGVETKRYDLGLVDGPKVTTDRPPCIEYAIARCTHVLVPTEDDGRVDVSFLRPVLREMAHRLNRQLRIVETGPLAGGFALFSPSQETV